MHVHAHSRVCIHTYTYKYIYIFSYTYIYLANVHTLVVYMHERKLHIAEYESATKRQRNGLEPSEVAELCKVIAKAWIKRMWGFSRDFVV